MKLYLFPWLLDARQKYSTDSASNSISSAYRRFLIIIKPQILKQEQTKIPPL